MFQLYNNNNITALVSMTEALSITYTLDLELTLMKVFCLEMAKASLTSGRRQTTSVSCRLHESPCNTRQLPVNNNVLQACVIEFVNS